MGLDLYFDRKAAIDAGLKVFIERNGTDTSIAVAEAHNEDPEYIAWLKAESEVIAIPDTGMHVSNDGIDDRIAIRANKWGRVYEPMTNWLKTNNITWGEY